MKTISSTVTPLGGHSAADTASRAPAETRRPGRMLGSILPALGRRLGARPSAPSVRTPVQRLEQFSAAHAPAPAASSTTAPPAQQRRADNEASTSAAPKVALGNLVGLPEEDRVPGLPRATLAQLLRMNDDDSAPSSPRESPAPRVSAEGGRRAAARTGMSTSPASSSSYSSASASSSSSSSASSPVRAATANAANAAPTTPAPAPAATAAAPAARPTAYGKLASGPKIDCMSDVLTSIYRMDDQQVSHITEALGMGPVAAPGRERRAQLKAAGRLLREPLEHKAAMPDPGAIARMPFGRGVPPEVLDELVEAATNLNCFVTERQVTGRDGKTVNMLQVHLANRFDQTGDPLASQPDSDNHHAVQELAMRFAEALSPLIRTDEKQYRIEYVACPRAQGGSADVFTAHLPKDGASAQPPAIKLTSEHYVEARLRTSHLFDRMSADDREKLVRAAHVAHMEWDEKLVRDEHGKQRLDVCVMFGGTQNMRDVKNAFSSIGQSVGKVFKANHEAAVLVAKAIEHAHAHGAHLKFDYIAGGSMGGASAQLFAAAVESRVKLQDPVPLILYDPQLPNQAQAKHAIKDGKLGYDYAKPRGIAVTLDYAQQPRKSLMGRMKGLGFKSPGLVRLKLGLSAYDRIKRLPNGETEQRPPVPLGPPGMGYHADPGLYQMALKRFTGRTMLRD